MPMSEEEIKNRILKAIPNAKIEMQDLAGDNDHWQATIISEAFAGLSKVKQHQLVYGALGDDMGTTLHALSIETKEK